MSFQAIVAELRQAPFEQLRVSLRLLPIYERLPIIEMLFKPLLDDDMKPVPPVITREQAHVLVDDLTEFDEVTRKTAHTLVDRVLERDCPASH